MTHRTAPRTRVRSAGPAELATEAASGGPGARRRPGAVRDAGEAGACARARAHARGRAHKRGSVPHDAPARRAVAQRARGFDRRARGIRLPLGDLEHLQADALRGEPGLPRGERYLPQAHRGAACARDVGRDLRRRPDHRRVCRSSSCSASRSWSRSRPPRLPRVPRRDAASRSPRRPDGDAQGRGAQPRGPCAGARGYEAGVSSMRDIESQAKLGKAMEVGALQRDGRVAAR